MSDSTRKAATIFAIVIGAFLVLGAAFESNDLFGPTVAAWVQAVGSIAAIYYATRAAGAAGRAAERRDRAAQTAYRDLIRDSVTQAMRCLNEVRKLDPVADRERIKEILVKRTESDRHMLGLLMRDPIATWPSAAAFYAALMVFERIPKSEGSILGIFGAYAGPPGGATEQAEKETIRKALADVDDAVGKLETALNLTA